MSSEFSETVLEREFMQPVLAYGFRWATKDCVEISGLPDNPVASRRPYEGEQIQRLGIMGKLAMELHLKTTVTMCITKARKKREEPSDLNAALAQLIKLASAHGAEHFAQPGETVGGYSYPAENSKTFVGLFWKGSIIKMSFRAVTYLDYAQPDPYNPRDPMEPFAEHF